MVQAASFVFQAVITPLLIGSLGAGLYGVWITTQQFAGFLTASDFRAMGSLKYLLMTRQHSEDDQEKRRIMGAVLLVSVCSIPLVAIAVYLLWLALPMVISSSDSLVQAQGILVVLAIGTSLARITALSENVLRGQNLQHTSLLPELTALAVTGAAIAVFLSAGRGIIWIAAATVLGELVSHGMFYVVAKRRLMWFGLEKPRRDEFRLVTLVSADVFFAALFGHLAFSLEMPLVGRMFGMEQVTSLVVAAMLPRGLAQLAAGWFSAATPGVGGMCGLKQWDELSRVQDEMASGIFLLFGSMGAAIVVMNGAWVSRWVGDRFVPPPGMTAALMVLSFQMTHFRMKSAVSDGMGLFKAKSAALALSAALMGGCLLLNGRVGLQGLLWALVIARLPLLMIPTWAIRRMQGGVAGTLDFGSVRPFAILALLLTFGSLLPAPQSLPLSAVAAGFGLLSALTGSLMWWLGLTESQRQRLWVRGASLFERLRANA